LRGQGVTKLEKNMEQKPLMNQISVCEE
jgi:hypothetical protein